MGAVKRLMEEEWGNEDPPAGHCGMCGEPDDNPNIHACERCRRELLDE